MLAAYMDVSAHVELQGDRQAVRAQLRGLRLETQVDLGAHDGQVRCRLGVGSRLVWQPDC